MRISRSMVRILIGLAEGATSLPALAQKAGLSQNRCSELTIRLEEAHLLARERRGMRTLLKLSDSPIATSFREMYLSAPQMKYVNFLYGARLDLLQLLIYEPKSVNALSKIIGASKPAVRGNMRSLLYANLLWGEKTRYLLSRKAHPKIYSFLHALRTFTPENKIIMWKFNDEEIFRMRNPAQVTEPTGFNRFGDFGVEVRTIDCLCVAPKRALGKGEIFAHGLMQVYDPRTLAIAVTFYLKNAIKEKSLAFLLEKYDLVRKFAEFSKTVDTFIKDNNAGIANTLLPSITGEEIRRTLAIYGVKHV